MLDDQLKNDTRRLIFIVFFFVFIYFIPLPLTISEPGEVEPLSKIVKVDNGYKSKKGSFLLVTVLVGDANLYDLISAGLNPYVHVSKKALGINATSVSVEDEKKQQKLMENSKKMATISAFRAAKKDIDLVFEGIYVFELLEGYPAFEKLKKGDVIVKIDGIKFKETREFIDYIRSKKVGEYVTLGIYRDDQFITKKVGLAMLKDENGVDTNVGIGISLKEKHGISTNPSVKIDTGEITGPSAGLMFGLEIYNQLVEKDITKGYKIAGTGTINVNGDVGSVGGVDEKVVAAHRAECDIFFVPKGIFQYDLAKKTAENLKSNMKIIGVENFSQALEYLEKQVPKVE